MEIVLGDYEPGKTSREFTTRNPHSIGRVVIANSSENDGMQAYVSVRLPCLNEIALDRRIRLKEFLRYDNAVIGIVAQGVRQMGQMVSDYGPDQRWYERVENYFNASRSDDQLSA